MRENYGPHMLHSSTASEDETVRISGLVVEYSIAIAVTRVRFPADASMQLCMTTSWPGAEMPKTPKQSVFVEHT